jgi:hypothetical protein
MEAKEDLPTFDPAGLDELEKAVTAIEERFNPPVAVVKRGRGRPRKL